MNIQQIKQRFGIIGNSPQLNRAIEVAMQVAPTDLAVLITGESGTGKEVMPQIIHHLSARKHKEYIAVNCGAIPEGTIDSELFGHEKGSFTGAHDSRKGYFEVANGGTIFLDEVAELPLQTQVRLLRVLETGEFMKVGSSKVIKTDVRVTAATNVNVLEAIRKGRFREDLYYRLNTVPIHLPSLRQRKEDIHLIFRKFASDFADKYKMPGIQLSQDAVSLLENYPWPGNIRQLKNITEQISVIEEERTVTPEMLLRYLPDSQASLLPAVVNSEKSGADFSEREILYKVLFDMKSDLHDLKKLVLGIMQEGGQPDKEDMALIKKLYQSEDGWKSLEPAQTEVSREHENTFDRYPEPIEIEESLSLEATERELIKKALKKHNNKRKDAARELGISERTLYRKIKEYDLN
ncbi:MAG: sigma-54-dependent Fis family transcriptional regulator [Cryomorphaceae bacterium]|nr:MAG: sigma-54-dependent Fis family transcriptional regulator [Cryomorphaceae bacterium]